MTDEALPTNASESSTMTLAEDRRALLERYCDLLLEANREFNLTAIRSREEAWERHIVESVRIAEVLPRLGKKARLIDVGSGGGLPGMVIAIARPDLSVTLLEATEKKARFLRQTADTLDLGNVKVEANRAEMAAAPGSPLRQSFDLVTARAVAPLRTLLEITVPFLRVGGKLVAVKGQRAQDELDEARRAQAVLHTSLEETIRQPSATVLVFEKTQSTSDKYPRRSGEPKRRPL